ncbi:GNAT family N-acetyltransferase [Vibrio ziniensis]|uniref:GNAT family N-acetyltransferase n=1 Tax=Vibrio ziniensis TaxID=2711221 RepID=A0A6G7CLZ5_9VIBR|nr:GNAT family N-acetyltransferase [Vibrio ziniensis]QIH43068.1 GNAT family N-acetyltransferase [Vibrio ziniensis]
MKIREGSLSEVVKVVTEIEEFIVKENEQSLAQRLDGKRHLILVAEQQGKILGFKIGYELDSETFYSWFGGVSPKARNMGLAQKLLDEQEKWVIDKKYQQLKVKSRNQFPAMLRLLLRNHYLIESFEPYEPLLESRIHFVKQLKNK